MFSWPRVSQVYAERIHKLKGSSLSEPEASIGAWPAGLPHG
jgi:hypothetical protein